VGHGSRLPFSREAQFTAMARADVLARNGSGDGGVGGMPIARLYR